MTLISNLAVAMAEGHAALKQAKTASETAAQLLKQDKADKEEDQQKEANVSNEIKELKEGKFSLYFFYFLCKGGSVILSARSQKQVSQVKNTP